MSDSVRPHRRQPTRLPRPWDSPGKNTGVGCHFLLPRIKVRSFSRVQLLATPWTAAYQAPPSMGFSRQEDWSGVPLPSPKALTHSSNYLIFNCFFVSRKGSLGKMKLKTSPVLNLGLSVCGMFYFPSELIGGKA